MRNLRSAKITRSGTSIALLAFLCALAAHAALLIPRYKTSAAKRQLSGSGIEMLNFASLAETERRNLSRWIAVHDPARSVRSASPSGYTAHLPGPPPRSVTVRPFPDTAVRSRASVSPFAPVPTAAEGSRTLPESPEGAVPFPAISRRVRILDQEGSPKFEQLFSFPADAAAAKPSVISFSRIGNAVRITLLDSCGKPGLDRLAAAAASKIPPEKIPASLFFFWPPEVKK